MHHFSKNFSKTKDGRYLHLKAICEEAERLWSRDLECQTHIMHLLSRYIKLQTLFDKRSEDGIEPLSN